ncbi:MAG: iron complex outermembrane receptor protein [Halieaceae bacterium]|jgi:iron complex outermembrane receptor protein
MFSRHKLSTAVLTALSLSAPGAAFSQDSSDENMFVLEEIMVTARKVGESIQDIPLSVQAFTADTIMKQQIIDVEDLA